MLKSEKSEFFEMLDFYLSYWQRWPTCCCNSGFLKSRDQDGIRHARDGLGELQWRQKIWHLGRPEGKRKEDGIGRVSGFNTSKSLARLMERPWAEVTCRTIPHLRDWAFLSVLAALNPRLGGASGKPGLCEWAVVDSDPSEITFSAAQSVSGAFSRQYHACFGSKAFYTAEGAVTWYNHSRWQWARPLNILKVQVIWTSNPTSVNFP